MRTSIIFCLGSLIATAGSLGTAAAQTTPLAKVEVTVDIFSGLPNPVFELDQSELNELKARFDKATKPTQQRADETARLPRLGYRGLFIDNPAKLFELPSSITIYRNDIYVDDGGKAALVANEDLEVFLLEVALEKGAISQDLHDRIRSLQRDDY